MPNRKLGHTAFSCIDPPDDETGCEAKFRESLSNSVMDDRNCAIWHTEARMRPRPKGVGPHRILLMDSPRAGGKYQIDDVLDYELRERPDGLWKVRLTTWLVNERRLGNEWPVVTRKRVEEAREGSIGNMPVTQRADRILLYLADRSQQTLGRAVNFDARPNPGSSIERREMYYQMLAHSASLNSEELLCLVRYLAEQELITYMRISSDHDQLVVTVPGYARVEKLKQEVNPASDRVFVAMWYHETTKDVWKKGIEPAIKEAGYEPVLIKDQHYVGLIVDKIISEIRRARFVVVDYTHGEPGRAEVSITKRDTPVEGG